MKDERNPNAYIEDMSYVRAARKRHPDLPPEFLFYLFDWGNTDFRNPKPTDTMTLTGCLFREAKKGKNKGALVVQVKNSMRVVTVTRAEMDAIGDGK